jgi:hypothetical protein
MSQWIPVEDRPPPGECLVEVWVEEQRERDGEWWVRGTSFPACHKGGAFLNAFFDLSRVRVTHWRPIQAPPLECSYSWRQVTL